MNLLNVIELDTLNGRIIWYGNCISIKLLERETDRQTDRHGDTSSDGARVLYKQKRRLMYL